MSGTRKHAHHDDGDDDMGDSILANVTSTQQPQDDDETTDGTGATANVGSKSSSSSSSSSSDNEEEAAAASSQRDDTPSSQKNASKKGRGGGKKQQQQQTTKKGKGAGNGGMGKRIMPSTLFDTRESEDPEGAKLKQEFNKRRSRMVGGRLLGLHQKRHPQWRGIRRYNGLKQDFGNQMYTTLTSVIKRSLMHHLMDAFGASGYAPVLVKGRSAGATGGGKSRTKYSLNFFKVGKGKAVYDGENKVHGIPRTLNAGHVLRAAQTDPYARVYLNNLLSSEGYLTSGNGNYVAPSKNDCIAQLTVYKEEALKASLAGKKAAKKAKTLKKQ